jgi:hypothetical protein
LKGKKRVGRGDREKARGVVSCARRARPSLSILLNASICTYLAPRCVESEHGAPPKLNMGGADPCVQDEQINVRADPL